MSNQSSEIFGIFNIFFSFPKSTFNEGDDVSEVVLDQSNDKTTVGDYKGKWLVMFFYPMDNSPGCTKEAQTFSNLIEDFHEQNAEVIGISRDSEQKHQKFINSKGLKVKLLSDPDGRLAKLFGVKILFGVCSRDSVVINPDGKVEKIHQSVSPASSPGEILKDIQEKNAETQQKG